jgi:hypothetical protein
MGQPNHSTCVINPLGTGCHFCCCKSQLWSSLFKSKEKESIAQPSQPIQLNLFASKIKEGKFRAFLWYFT